MLEVVVNHGWWNTYTFGDYVDERFRRAIHGQGPRGYRLRLGVTSAGLAWNANGWILDADRSTGAMWAPRIIGLTEQRRAAILRVKIGPQRGELRASGVEIYTAVLACVGLSCFGRGVHRMVARKARSPDHGPRS